MASTTPCCAKPDPVRRRLGWLLLGFSLLFGAPALAGERNAVRQAAVVATAQGYALDAEIDIALNHTLENALIRGIVLHFLLELEITRPRNWWFDADIAAPTRKMRLYYHLLLRRYVVESGYTTRTVSTLDEALALLGRVDDWLILEQDALDPRERYDARLRLRLDTDELPKPLSIGVVTSDQWQLATPWHAWSFRPPVAAGSPQP